MERNVTVSSPLNHYLFLNGLDTDTVLAAGWPDLETRRRLDSLTVGDMILKVEGSEAFLKLPRCPRRHPHQFYPRLWELSLTSLIISATRIFSAFVEETISCPRPW